MSVERNVSHTLVLRVILTIFMMLQSVFVTRILGPEGRGLFAKFQAAQNFLILFLGLGVTSAVIYYVHNRKLTPEKFMGTSIWVWFGGLFGLLLFLVVFYFVPSADLIFPVGYRLPFFKIYFF